MKMSKSQFIYLLLAMCLLFQNKFFHLMNGSPVNTVFMLSTILIMFLVAMNGKYDQHLRYLYRYLIFLTCFVIIPQTVYAFSQGETFANYMDVLYGMIYIFLCVPLYRLMENDNSCEKVFELISLFTAITCGLVLINSISLNIRGVPILPFDYFQMPTSSMRNGRIRIVLISELIGIVPIYTFCKALTCKKRKKYLVEFAASLGCLLYVEQTRMLWVAVVAGCLIVLIKTLYGDRKIVFWGLSGLIVGIGLFNEWFSGLFDLVSTAGAYGMSNSIRIAEYNYAFRLIAEHPVLGTGMVSQHLYLRDFTLAGVDYLFGYSDIGLIGTVTYIGIIGALVLFMFPYIRFWKTLLKHRKTEQKRFGYLLMIGIMIYITISATTLMVTDTARVFQWPFILSLFEFERKKICAVEVESM